MGRKVLAHLGTLPVDREEAGDGLDGVIPSYTGLRSKKRALLQDTEMREAALAEKRSPPKPKAAKGKKNNKTASFDKAPSQNPSTQGASQGVAKGRVAKAARKDATALARSAVKVTQSTRAVFVEP